MSQISPSDPEYGHPPLDQGDVEFEAPSKWPTVIGVIGVIWASLGLVCGCAGYFALPMQRWGAKMAAEAGQPNAVAEAQIRIAEQYQIPTFILLTLGMVLSIWLLIGSINLLRRRQNARGALLGWAIASLLLLALNIALQVVVFQATVQELQNTGESQRVGELYIGIAIGAFILVVFGLGPQVFTLIWFSRAKIKAEVDRWR